MKDIIAKLKQSLEGNYPQHTHILLNGYKKDQGEIIHKLKEEVLHEHEFFVVLDQLDHIIKRIRSTPSESEKEHIYKLLAKLEHEYNKIRQEKNEIAHLELAG